MFTYVRARFTLILFASLSFTVSPASAQSDDQTVRKLKALRVTGPIVVDGRLSEPDWQLAQVATDFAQNDPSEGAPASERTEVRVLYDDDTLYIGAFAHHQNRDDIVVNELKRDFDGSSTDWMAVILDTFHDGRNGYQFGVNPAGAMWDSQKFNEGRERNLSWDGAWTVRTSSPPTVGTPNSRFRFEPSRFRERIPRAGALTFNDTCSGGSRTAFGHQFRGSTRWIACLEPAPWNTWQA